MGKAEERALEKYPKKIEWVGNQWDGAPFDVNCKSRVAYKQGYEQAEKDLLENKHEKSWRLDEKLWKDIKDIEEASYQYVYDASNDWFYDIPTWEDVQDAFKAGAKWQKEHFWKSADGEDLPEIDREVVALLDNGKVVFAHRPPEYWDGKNIVTGKVTRSYPKTYDKGGWNQPDVKWWLDCLMPKVIEL